MSTCVFALRTLWGLGLKQILRGNSVWFERRENMERSTMIGRIKDGRLSMPDFEIIDKSLKAGWVKRLLDPQAQSWKTIPFSLLDSVGDSLLFNCNFSLRTLPELPLLPLFYRNVLSAWESISKHTTRTKNEIENAILWNNHEVTIGGKSVFYKQWFDATTSCKIVETLSVKNDFFMKKTSWLTRETFHWHLDPLPLFSVVHLSFQFGHRYTQHW